MTGFDPSTLEVERLFAATLGHGLRTVGITAPLWGSGTTSLAQALAARSGLARQKTLYVDLSTSVQKEPSLEAGGWQPSQRGPAACVHEDNGQPYDTLTLHANLADAMRVRDIDRLRIAFNSDLIHYRSIVVDLPPVPHSNPAALPSNIGISACEAVVLVNLVGAVTDENLSDAYEAIQATGTPLTGLVLNDRDAPTLGEEMAREAMRLRRVFPWLARRLSKQALSSKLLNTRP